MPEPKNNSSAKKNSKKKASAKKPRRTVSKSTKRPKISTEEWDDVDITIYELRVKRRLPWRAIAEELGLKSHQSVMRRFRRRMQEIEPGDLEVLREEESIKFDDLEARWMGYISRAMKSEDLVAEARGYEGLRRIMRDRSTIMGTARPAKVEVVVTRDELAGKLDAYLQGAAEANLEVLE